MILTFGCLPLRAQTATDHNEFYNALSESSSKNKTITSKFKQIKKTRGIAQTVENTGTFYYDHRGQMALYYDQPQGNRLVMNDEYFLITAAGKTNKVKSSDNPMLAQVSNMMQACMSGDVSKLGRGWETLIERSNNDYQVTLIPTERRAKKYIHSIVMNFSSEDLTLNVLRMNEAGDGYTEYMFIDKEMNKAIDSSVFEEVKR